MSYPSGDKISKMIDLEGRSPNLDNFDPKVDWTFVGGDHVVMKDIKGTAELKEWYESILLKSLEVSDPAHDRKVIRVIGGGMSPWACVETKTKRESQSGREIYQGYAWVLHFNKNKKIDRVRLYIGGGVGRGNAGSTKL